MMSGFNTNASTLFNTNSTFTNQQQQSQQPQHQYQQPQQQQQQQQQQPQQQRERLPSFLFSPSAVNNNNNSNNNNPNRPSPSSSIANTTTPSVITTPTETDTFNDDSFNQQSQNMNANPWPFDNQSSRGMNQSSSRSQGIAFNDRLRIDRSYNDTTNMNPVSFENNSMMNSQQQQQNRASSRLPPSKSLLDSGPPSVMQLRTPSSTPSTHGRPTSTPVTTNAPSMPSSTPTPRFVSSAPSPGMSPYTTANANNNNDQNTPSNVNNELVNRWITVFGFSGSETESQALREFRRHGDIVRTVPGKGNWIHILYRTQLQAQVALYRPWRILTGTDIMIGVVPCTEPEIAKSEDETIEKGFLVASPANHSNNLYPMSPSPNTPQTQSPSQVARMKSPGGGTGLRTPSDLLRRGGRSGNDDMRVGGANNMEDSAQRTQTIVQTPQRQTGIFEYISGFYK